LALIRIKGARRAIIFNGAKMSARRKPGRKRQGRIAMVRAGFKHFAAFAVCAIVMAARPAGAQEALVTHKSLSPEIALELARATLEDCRKRGFQVAVAVVDRFGQTQVMIRDRFAGPHTPATAAGKGWTAVSFRTNTTDLVGISQPGMPQAGLRDLPGAVILGGGVRVEAGGVTVGAVGVSGAPGGDADDACAKAGIAAVQDKLDF
jgi:uncharacterized protein GlcG (DUF336 family)